MAGADVTSSAQQNREAQRIADRIASGEKPAGLPPRAQPPATGTSIGRNFDDGPGDAEQIAKRNEYEKAKKADARRNAIMRAEERGDWDHDGRFVRSSWSSDLTSTCGITEVEL